MKPLSQRLRKNLKAFVAWTDSNFEKLKQEKGVIISGVLCTFPCSLSLFSIRGEESDEEKGGGFQRYRQPLSLGGLSLSSGSSVKT